MLRVLIVDDNHDVADCMVALVQTLGHDARCAYSGAEALSSAAVYLPHVALVDIAMPNMDGWEVGRRLRKMPGGELLAMAALTGYGQLADKRHSQEAGFDCHFVKPIEIEVLAAFLHSIAGIERS